MAMPISGQVGIVNDHSRDHRSSGSSNSQECRFLQGRCHGVGVSDDFNGGTVSWRNHWVATFRRLHRSNSERRTSIRSGGPSCWRHRCSARRSASQAKVCADCDQGPGEDSPRRSRGCDRRRSQRELYSVAAHFRLPQAARIHLHDGGEVESARVSANPSIGVGERSPGGRNPALAHGRVCAPHQGRKRVHRHPHLQEESTTPRAVVDRHRRFCCRVNTYQPDRATDWEVLPSAQFAPRSRSGSARLCATSQATEPPRE